MGAAQFWRMSGSHANQLKDLPTDLQQSGSTRPKPGDGVVIGDLDMEARVILVPHIGVVERVLDDESLLQINWRPTHFVLEPSPQGARYWADRPTFRFDDDVAERYQLDHCFADAFGTTDWASERRRFPLDK
jgi:hypothetical protein